MHLDTDTGLRNRIFNGPREKKRFVQQTNVMYARTNVIFATFILNVVDRRSMFSRDRGIPFASQYLKPTRTNKGKSSFALLCNYASA